MVSPELNERWNLPFDVLSGVMAVSQRSTISAFMKTCRALYTEGLKHLLLDGVQLPSTCQITKFATFMLTKDPSRFAYLRKLVLLVEFLAYTDAEVHLVQLLSHPSLALETLVLHPAETLVGCLTDPAIRAAIGQLTTVKRLVAVGVDSYFAPLINRLPCHLESISISLKYSVREVLPTVAPFSDTLRTLLVDSEPCVLGGFFGADPRSCRFPRVQTFGIVYHKYIPDLLASSAFIETLPAITHLQLIPSDPPTTRRLVRVLGPSLESSQLPDGRRPESAPSFPSLTECSGGLRSVYALHLDCTLSTLRLWQSVAADELHILRAVLEDTRPSRLCLSTKLADVKPLLATLCTLVPPKRIDVEIFVPEEATTQLRSALEALLQGLSMGLPVVELNLLFDVTSSAGDRTAEKSIIRDILKAFTSQASAAAPASLRFICRLSEDEDERDWQWPDLGQRVYRDRDIDWDAEDNRFPFGDGEHVAVDVWSGSLGCLRQSGSLSGF